MAINPPFPSVLYLEHWKHVRIALQSIKSLRHKGLMPMRDRLAWTAGNGDPMHGVCISKRLSHAWEQKADIKIIVKQL